jgi:hypothetical protein
MRKMVNLLSQTISWLALAVVVACCAAITSAQTAGELRAKYGVPQTSQLKNGRPTVERFLVRPKILMTMRHTKQGLPCEAVLEPVPSSTPKLGRGEHAPEGDYMSTAEVIKLINELVPIEKRGKKINERSMNGGDPEMKLHHPGCSGVYFAYFENVSFTCSTWCWGGTFSVTIHWGKASCRGQSIKVKKTRPLVVG